MGKIEKTDTEDALAAVLSFSDINVIASIFDQMGYTLSFEIEETIKLVQQSENLSVKLSAIKMLRELMNDAAEKSGLIANVSRTIPGEGGASTTYHARQMALALAPASKQIKSKVIEEKEDEQESKIPETEIDDGGSSGEETEPSAESTKINVDCRTLHTPENNTIANSPDSGGDGQDSDGFSGGGSDAGVNREDGPGVRGISAESDETNPETSFFRNNTCVDGKPPEGINRQLFRGVTGDPDSK